MAAAASRSSGRVADEAHAAGLAAAAREHLGLDGQREAEPGGRALGFLHRARQPRRRHRDAGGGEELLGLVFEEVHDVCHQAYRGAPAGSPAAPAASRCRLGDCLRSPPSPPRSCGRAGFPDARSGIARPAAGVPAMTLTSLRSREGSCQVISNGLHGGVRYNPPMDSTSVYSGAFDRLVAGVVPYVPPAHRAASRAAIRGGCTSRKTRCAPCESSTRRDCRRRSTSSAKPSPTRPPPRLPQTST